MSDTTDLSALRAAPGIVTHDAPGMTESEEKALWDALFAAQHALQGAQWPLARVIREHDRRMQLSCPWCDSDLGQLGAPLATDEAPRVHRVLVGLTFQSPLSIELVRPGTLNAEPVFEIGMSDGGDAPDDSDVAWSCDECDHAIRIPGEVIW